MVKFAHLADVHLGSWRYPEMRDLNLRAFKQAIDTCIQEQVQFVIIAGDLFDIAMPSVDILKETVAELRRLKENNINCYIIAGSHDYSVTGKTFIDVLEKGGFCKNIANVDEESQFLRLIQENNILLAGIPGRKTSLELEHFKKLRLESLENYQNLLKIFVFHTTLTESKPAEMMQSLDINNLPSGFDYYAAGHLHIVDVRKKDNKPVVYPGPIFPNNSEELEELRQGSFFIVDYNKQTKQCNLEKKDIRFNDVLLVDLDVNNLPIEETNKKVLDELENKDIKDKILILKIRGCLASGKTHQIDQEKIREKTKDAYFLLKNFSKLTTKELEIDVEIKNRTIESIENEFIETYKVQVNEEFKALSGFIHSLINNLEFEKDEGEKKDDFNQRVFETVSKIIPIENEIKEN
ncbi:MAG: DNA repair exonuclease [archaeon]|nr:MAG: DNA repair exonuclease [archaeon]